MVKFYQCDHCKNTVEMIYDAGVPLVCCGQKMSALVPGTVEASKEKHIPVVKVEGDQVFIEVGSLPHPMIAEHFIEWIVLETTTGVQRKQLHPNEQPHACFKLCDNESVVAAYAYCNLHGLWKACGNV